LNMYMCYRRYRNFFLQAQELIYGGTATEPDGPSG